MAHHLPNDTALLTPLTARGALLRSGWFARTSRLMTFIGGLLCATPFLPAAAFEFVSVTEPAILYDAPSLKAKKLFVATRFLPLEQIVVLDNWSKVRDHTGKLYWIEKRALSTQRFVMVIPTVAAVRNAPDEKSPVMFRAAQYVALQWLENGGMGWLKVRHQDGATGFVRSTEVWGE